MSAQKKVPLYSYAALEQSQVAAEDDATQLIFVWFSNVDIYFLFWFLLHLIWKQ